MMVTYVDVTTIALAVESVVRASHEKAVVVGVENTRLEADRRELADLVGLGDSVAHVVADSSLIRSGALAHLSNGSLSESLTGLDSD
jgi:hypothetical protein